MKIISVLFARTSELWWDGLARLLAEMHQFQIVGISCTGLETIEAASKLRPDVILLDEEMSGCDCIEVAQNMNSISPDTNIMIITKPYKNIDTNSIFKTRAKAYIDKDITITDLVKAIDNVSKGGMVVISPLVALKILENLDKENEEKEFTHHEFDISLTKRETEILSLLAFKGVTNKEIADKLYISENTVKTHLASIIRKMNVGNRQQAAAKAREIRLFKLPKALNQEK